MGTHSAFGEALLITPKGGGLFMSDTSPPSTLSADTTHPNTGLLHVRNITVKRAALFALLLIWFSIGAWRGLTIDEYTTWQNTRKDIADLIENRLRAGHLPTYFVIESLWVRLAGDDEMSLRVPSMLLVTTGAMFLFFFLNNVFCRHLARLTLLFFVLNQVVVWCAQNARPYSGLICSSALGIWALERWYSRRRLGYLGLLFFSVALGMSFYAAFAFTVVAWICAILISRHQTDKRVKWAAAGAVLLPAIIMAVPVVLLAEKQEKFAFEGNATFDLRRPFNLLARTVFGDYKLWALGGMRYLALILFAAAMYGVYRWHGEHSPTEKKSVPCASVSFFSIWFIVPVVGLWIAEIITRANILSHPRYFVHILIPSAILVALGADYLQRQLFARLRHRLIGIIPIIMLGGFSAANTLAWFRTNGDGPHVVAPAILAIAPPVSVVLGNTHPLEYEWRNSHHPELLPLYPRDTSEVVRSVAELTSGTERFCLFIYNNKLTALDQFAEMAPNFQLNSLSKFQFGDARAHVYQRLGE